MRIKGLFKRDPAASAAQALYAQVVEQARLPRFYRDLGVPDTLDGRFDMIVLHAFLVLHRLKAEGQAQGPVGQALFDLMFADMDASLRELGVGDLSVGRKVKQMATGFYGRVAAYEEGLATEGVAGAASGDDALAAALRRNLYGTTTADPAHVAAMALYVRRQAAALAGQPAAALTGGTVRFVAPETAP
jgi:cytochrome b pre-mRNA-processing protein 3